MKSTRVLSLLLLTPVVALAWQVCEVTFPTAAFSIPHLAQAPELNTDPHSATWSHAASAWIVKDCTQQIDYPKLKTEVRAFWTDSDLYLLLSPRMTSLIFGCRRITAKIASSCGTLTWPMSCWGTIGQT